jgi:predicted DCC family thiol-disulfide oxidoreductase YuxK
MDIDLDDAEGFDPNRMEKPVLVWDGDCGFCKRSVLRVVRQVGDRIRYVTYQSVHEQFETIDEEDFQTSVYFIEPDGRAYRGAEAVYRAFSWRPKGSLLLRMYHDVPGFAGLSEWGYRRVANNRQLASRLTKWIPNF